MLNEEYIKKADLTIQEYLYTTLYNTSFILDDSEGKISDRAYRFIEKNLPLTSSGMIKGIDYVNPDTKYNSLLGDNNIVPQLSEKAYEVFKELSGVKSPLIKPVSYYKGNNELPECLDQPRGTSETSLTYVAYAYLELYALFLSLISYKSGELFGHTEDELDIIDMNLRKMRDNSSTIDTTPDSYSVLNVLKLIHRTILFVRANMKIVLR